MEDNTSDVVDFDDIDGDGDDLGKKSAYIPGSKVLKTSIFLFVVFILLNSDVFIDRVLSDREGKYAKGRQVTYNGLYVQSLLLVIAYVIFDMLVNHGLV